MDPRMFKKHNFLYRIFTFSGCVSAGEFWWGLCMRLFSFFAATIALCIFLSSVLPATAEQIIEIVNVAVPLLGIVWLIPIAALTRRRFRDGNISVKNYFWLLLPVIGWIVFIVRLCARSVNDHPDETSAIFYQ